MFRLREPSPQAWLNCVMGEFDAFLVDHAACERKASATAMSLVAHYPDKPELVDAMIGLAREELEHFHDVVRIMAKRDLELGKDQKDAYVRGLLSQVRQGTDAYFLDRLILAGVVEARGCERFGPIAEALPKGELKTFYEEITRSESRHHGLFLRLAKKYFDATEVDKRLEDVLDHETEVMKGLPIKPALH